MINVPELRKTLEFITANPEKHYQAQWFYADTIHGGCETVEAKDFFGHPTSLAIATEKAVWSCGTTGCVAGWSAMSHGWRPVVSDSVAVYKDGEVCSAHDVASDILGLGDGRNHMMFRGGNTLHDLWLLANVFTNGEIEIPEYVKPSINDEWTRDKIARYLIMVDSDLDED